MFKFVFLESVDYIVLCYIIMWLDIVLVILVRSYGNLENGVIFFQEVNIFKYFLIYLNIKI